MGARDVFDDLVAGGWARVQQWVAAQQPESLNLDFKQRRTGAPPDELEAGDKDVLAKAMSGLANVDGGVLVFGLQTPPASKGDPNRLAPVQSAYLADTEAFKRALQRAFGSVTVPTVPGVTIEAITDPAASPVGVVAILVPSSEAKPHRTASHLKAEVNNKYFMRTDTDTVPMPHEMLGALFGRVPPASLKLLAKLEVRSPGSVTLELYLANRGRGVAHRSLVRIEYDQHQLLEPILAQNQNRTSLGSFLALEPDTYKTLYAGFEERLGALRVRRTYQNMAQSIRLRGTIFAENAQPVPFDEVVVFDRDVVELPR